METKRTSWLKLYDQSGTFIASFRHAEDAALVATNYGGSTIRDGHQKKRTLWTEGNEVTTGSESADQCARIIYDRLDAMRLEDDRRNAARPVLSGSAMYPGRYFSKSTAPPTTKS